MIWRVVDDDQLSATAQQMALHFASQPTFGLGLIKQAINAAETNTLDAQLDWSATISVWPVAATTTARASALSSRSARLTLRGNKMLNIRTVAVIGSGTMGAGLQKWRPATGIRCCSTTSPAMRYPALSRDPPASGLPGDARKTLRRCREPDPRPAASRHGYRRALRGRTGD